MPFVREVPVRFPDVDYARVVYYPRFFDYCHQVFEDFFAAEVGTPYAQMLQERKVGYPSVHASADFKSPLRFGDVVRIELTCERVSDRSITCTYRLSTAGQQHPQHCADVKVVVVPIDMDSFTGVPVPHDVRAAFERFAVLDRRGP